MKHPSWIIVDDDAEDIDIFRQAVREIDSKVSCSAVLNSEELLDRLQKMPEKPDYIFLDLNMPKVSGKECLALLKKHRGFKDIPVIIFTTSTRPQDMRETKALGAAYFLSKPGRFEDLKKALAFVLSGEWRSHQNLTPVPGNNPG